MFSIFDGCNAFFKGGSGWVAQASVQMLAMNFEILLDKSWTHVNQNIDTSVDFLGLLTDMDGHGGEAFMPDG